MSVFISYSHENKSFADKLAAHLVKNNTHVWVDTWELKVGNSIINKIQEAITESSALLVVLSKSSVSSVWCNKELTAGLIRELEEKRVVVLPVLLEDCEIPLFLKDKMYADFRNDFKAGLKSILEAIAAVINLNLGRIINSDTKLDWSIDWSYDNDLFQLRFTIVEHSDKYPFSILVEIYIICNKNATIRYKQYENISLDWLGRIIITESLGHLTDNRSFHVILEDQFPKQNTADIVDTKKDISFHIIIKTRKLGEDTGKDLIVNVGNYLEMIRSHMKQSGRKLTKEENIKILELLKNSF
jgi:hypothetical protein